MLFLFGKACFFVVNLKISDKIISLFTTKLSRILWQNWGKKATKLSRIFQIILSQIGAKIQWKVRENWRDFRRYFSPILPYNLSRKYRISLSDFESTSTRK